MKNVLVFPAKCRLVLLGALLLLVWGKVAWAQAGAPVAEALFNEARAAMQRGDYDLACRQFLESHRIDPATGTLLNLANCEEQRGKLATAWELFRAAAAQFERADERRAIAEQRAMALEARVPRLTIHIKKSAPQDTTVRRGEVELASAAFGVPLPIDPGNHHLIVKAKGHAEHTYDVEVAEGETRQIEVEPGPPVAAAKTLPIKQVPVETVQVSRARDASADSSPVFGYIAGGVGVAGLMVGTVTGILALNQKSIADDNCDDALKLCRQEGKDANDTGRSLALASSVGFSIGVLGVAVGTYFVLVGAEEEPATSVSLSVAPQMAGATLQHRW